MASCKTAILVVEDDAFKLDRVTSCLEPLWSSSSITVVKSVQGAVSAVANEKFDFILLDMSLPTHDLKPGGGAGTSLLSGGLEVIMDLSLLRRSEKVIILTQYPEIEIEGDLIPLDRVKAILNKMFEVEIDSVILYRQESSEWEGELLRSLEQSR
jgi:CheY-like chemotaxis protein